MEYSNNSVCSNTNLYSIYHDLDEIHLVLTSLDPEVKGLGLMTYKTENNIFVSQSNYGRRFSLVQKIANLFDSEATCTNLILGFTNLLNKTTKVFDNILNCSNISSDESKEINNKLKNIVNIINQKSKRCVKELVDTYIKREKINDDSIEQINLISNQIFDLLINQQQSLENKLDKEQDEADLSKMGESEDFEDFVFIDSEPSVNYLAAQKIVLNAKPYKENLIAVTTSLNTGIICPIKLIQDCLYDAKLKEKFSKQELADANNYFQPFAESMPLLSQNNRALWTSFSFLKDEEDIRILENSSVPTSQRNDKFPELDHLVNVKIQIDENDGHICITCGGIDSKIKADEFIAAIIFVLKGKGLEHHPKPPLRIVLHQVNSFMTDGSLVQQQHHFSRYIENKLRNYIEVCGNDIEKKLNIIYNPSSPIVSHVNLAFNIASILPSEHVKSQLQNLDGLTAQVIWTIENLSLLSQDEFLKNNPVFQKLLNKLEKSVALRQNVIILKNQLFQLDELISQESANNSLSLKESLNKKQNLEKELGIAQNELKTHLHNICKKTNTISNSLFNVENVTPSQRQTRFWTQLLTHILAKQTDYSDSITNTAFNRTTELELHLLFDSSLGLISEINCKSGLDRTGFARSLWDAMKSMEHEYIKMFSKQNIDTLEAKTMAQEKLLELILNLDASGTELDQIQQGIVYQTFSQNNVYNLENLKNTLPLETSSLRKLVLDEIEKKYGSDLKKKNLLIDTLKYQDFVGTNMFRVAQVITLESTGGAGLKYGQDTGVVYSAVSSNPHPLKRLPMFVTSSEGHIIQLYSSRRSPIPDENIWEIGGQKRILTNAGISLILRNSLKRGG